MQRKLLIQADGNFSLSRHHACHPISAQSLSEGTLRQNRMGPCLTVFAKARGGHALLFRQAVRRYPELTIPFTAGQIPGPRTLGFVEGHEPGAHLLRRAPRELREVLERDEESLIEVARVSHVQFVADRSAAEQIHRTFEKQQSDSASVSQEKP